jgi:hypothetical protein
LEWHLCSLSEQLMEVRKGKITLSALLLVEQNARSADARKSAFDGSVA